MRLFGIGENPASLEVKEEAESNPYSLFLILSMMFAADIPDMVPKRKNTPDSVHEQFYPQIISYEQQGSASITHYRGGFRALNTHPVPL